MLLAQDAADARAVAHKLGIELYVLNLADAFQPIIDYFVDEYRRGRTPNPCIPCNAQIKFGRLIRHADSLEFLGGHRPLRAHGIRGRASGHLAQVAAAQRPVYVLFAIARELLGRILFPLGDMPSKQNVREKARAFGLAVHDKPDSQEICFVPDNELRRISRPALPEMFQPGSIVDSSGKVLASIAASRLHHRQRKRLGIAGKTPCYVTHIDAASATVTVGPRDEVLHSHLQATQANWHCDLPAEFEARCRSATTTVQSWARAHDRPGWLRSRFVEPVIAVTPGQAAVCYQGDRVLGGAGSSPAW